MGQVAASGFDLRPRLQGAALGAASGAIGGGAVGTVLAAAAFPLVGKRALLMPFGLAAQFAAYGAVAGLVTGPGERHPQWSAGQRMVHGAVMPGAIATAALGAISVGLSLLLYKRGVLTGSEAAAMAALSTLVGGAGGAASGAGWGLLHG